jgi:hypothetical protein
MSLFDDDFYSTHISRRDRLLAVFENGRMPVSLFCRLYRVLR